MTQEIVDYILAAQKHGLTDFEIKQNLLSAGWEAPMVEESFGFAKAAEGRVEPGKGAESQPRETQKQGVFPNAKPEDFNKPNSPILNPLKPVISAPPISTSPAFKTSDPLIAMQSIHAPQTSAISDQNFTAAATKKKGPWKAIFIIVVIFLLLGGGAYGYYTYIYSPKPATIWERFLSNKKDPVFKNNFTVAYADNGVATATSTPQPISVSFGGNSSINVTDANNPQTKGNFNFGFQMGAANFNLQLAYLILNKTIYIDIGQIPQIKSLLPGQDLEWLKIDTQELQNYVNEHKSDLGTQNSNLLTQNPELNNKLRDIWSKQNLVKTTDFFAKEKIGDAAVYHIQNQFDQQAFSRALSDSLDAIESTANTATGTDLQTLNTEKNGILALLNKFTVKDFDVWIGQKDHELYKMHLTISAPSLKDLSSGNLVNAMPVLDSAQAKSRDAKRLADTRQMASALELYYNDFNGYPESSNGVPVGGITPGYIGIIPSAPVPVDGTCTGYYNTYWYQPSGKPTKSNGQTVYPNYTMTFCLGQDTGGYKAGIGQLSPGGIEAGLPCPTTPDKCVNNKPSSGTDFADIINKMSFSAEIRIDTANSDFGKVETFQAPDNAKDILELIKGSSPAMNEVNQSGNSQDLTQTPDAKRLADIRTLATALELYYNEKNDYPQSLSTLAPKYIGTLPVSPQTDLGVCSAADVNYSYSHVGQGNYILTFCLGTATGAYTAGKHSLSPAGIQ